MSPSARLAVSRLVRSRRSLAASIGWLLLALVAALVERAQPHPSAGHVLLGAFGAVALPLLAFGVVGASLGGQGLARAGRAVTAFGESPLVVAATTLLVCVAITTVACGAASAVVAALAHGAADPPLAGDALTSAWIGALGGAAYAAYFGLGAAILRGGSGRAIALAADWILGSADASGLVTPRAHLRSLFGGAGPLGISQRASVLALVVLLVAYAAAALAIARRSRR